MPDFPKDCPTTCPLSADESHDWQSDQEKSDFHVARYGCPCGARGWRRRALRKEPSKGNASPLLFADEPIRQYKEGSKSDRRHDSGKPREITARMHAGSNGAGHFLPGGSRGRGR